MSPSKTKLHALVDSLTDEQAERALELLVDLDAPPGCLSVDDPDYAEEIRRRLDDFESGREPGIPAEVVLGKLRARYPRT